MYRLGVDIGGTKINIGLFDFDKKTLIDNEKTYIKDIKSIVSHIKCTALSLCEKNGIPFENVSSVGVGIPGTVSDDGKKILKAPNINQIDIATGYWDIPGTSILADGLDKFLEREGTKLRILIGKDPYLFAKYNKLIYTSCNKESSI
jgi:hypothetical protein